MPGSGKEIVVMVGKRVYEGKKRGVHSERLMFREESNVPEKVLQNASPCSDCFELFASRAAASNQKIEVIVDYDFTNRKAESDQYFPDVLEKSTQRVMNQYPLRKPKPEGYKLVFNPDTSIDFIADGFSDIIRSAAKASVMPGPAVPAARQRARQKKKAKKR